MSGTGHRQIDHTADLALEIWAPTEAELLVEAARGIVDLLTEGATIQAAAERRVELDTFDPEDRLVRFTNEVLYWAISHGFLLSRAQLELTPERLVGTAYGEAGASDRIRTELKSVTYHDLLLEQTEAGFRARLVVDV